MVKFGKMSKGNIASVRGIGGATVPVLGEVTLPISIGSLQTSHKFFVLESMNYQMIIGMDFVTKYVSSIDIAGSKLILRNKKAISLFRLPTDYLVHPVNVCIPARSEMVIPVAVKDLACRDLSQVVISPVNSLGRVSMHVAGSCTVAAVKQGKTVYRVTNQTQSTITLKKDRPIAQQQIRRRKK